MTEWINQENRLTFTNSRKFIRHDDWTELNWYVCRTSPWLMMMEITTCHLYLIFPILLCCWCLFFLIVNLDFSEETYFRINSRNLPIWNDWWTLITYLSIEANIFLFCLQVYHLIKLILTILFFVKDVFRFFFNTFISLKKKIRLLRLHSKVSNFYAKC